MKYPAIYQSTVNGNAILLFSDKQGVVLDKHETVIGTSCGWIESAFKNITAEYLANTYGKVESKEHAEFIDELCEVNGIEVDSWDGREGYFSIDDRGLYFWFEEEGAMEYGGKQITIPLPQESEMSHYDDEREQAEIQHRMKTGTLKENGDNLMFGGDDKCKEWPCVGDEVIVSSAVGLRMSERTKCFDGKAGVLRALFSTKNGTKACAVEFHDMACFCFHVDMLKKPKTPEEELRDEIAQVMSDSYARVTEVVKGKAMFRHYAEDLMANYNITKKPQ